MARQAEKAMGAVIVTGGSRGIGAATCRMIAAQGHPVVVNYREDSTAALQLVQEIQKAGGRAIAIQADVARESSVAQLFQQTRDAFGSLYGLVNNAGVTGPIGAFEAAPLQAIEDVLRINVLGTMLCARSAIKAFRDAQAPGVIVNVSSVASSTGSPGEYVHYAASKAAVETFTLGLARELAGSAIRVCGVAPGSTLTEIHARAGEPNRPQRIAPRIPLGRLAEPEEIAEAIAWLLSPRASYVVGSTLRCTGGL